MKLKYLIRGIGIGVFGAGLVGLILSLTVGKMSDEQILARARALGYEDRNVVIQEIRSEDGPVKLTDQTPANSTKDTSEKNIATEVLPDGVENSETEDDSAKKAEEESAKKAEEEKKKAEEESAKKAEEEKKKAEEAKKAEEEKKKAEEEKKKAEEAKKAEEEKKKAEEEAKKQQSQATGETVTISVKSGQFSESVAKACESAGLVSSATEFDAYLCKNGYANRISVGDHKIAKGASFEEIAKALCK